MFSTQTITKLENQLVAEEARARVTREELKAELGPSPIMWNARAISTGILSTGLLLSGLASLIIGATRYNAQTSDNTVNVILIVAGGTLLSLSSCAVYLFLSVLCLRKIAIS